MQSGHAPGEPIVARVPQFCAGFQGVVFACVDARNISWLAIHHRARRGDVHGPGRRDLAHHRSLGQRGVRFSVRFTDDAGRRRRGLCEIRRVRHARTDRLLRGRRRRGEARRRDCRQCWRCVMGQQVGQLIAGFVDRRRCGGRRRRDERVNPRPRAAAAGRHGAAARSRAVAAMAA